MQAEQIIAIFNELAGKDSPKALGSVATAAGATRREVERVVLLIRSLPFFMFEPTSTGRMKRLEISAQSAGCYGHTLNLNSSRHFFYKEGVKVDCPDTLAPRVFAAQLQAEAVAAGLYFIPKEGRIEAMAPLMSAILVEQDAKEAREKAARAPVTRVRRGIEVVVPEQWVGQITTAETIRQRPSKLIGKVKRQMKPGVAYKDSKDMPLADE